MSRYTRAAGTAEREPTPRSLALQRSPFQQLPCYAGDSNIRVLVP
jgi:hypothetical protein